MKRKAAVLSIAFIVCALCASGITKNDNVTGDLQKDVKKCIEIMNKSGEVNNEDRKIMEEIATYYEAQGIIKEFEEEYKDSFWHRLNFCEMPLSRVMPMLSANLAGVERLSGVPWLLILIV